MPLVLEHWPARLRGLASGLMLGGWYWGYLLAAAAFQFIYPLFSDTPDLGLARDVLGVHHPGALHALDPRARARESGVARASAPAEGERRCAHEPKLSLVRIFQRDLLAHDDPDDARHRVVHVHLLLAELLVSDGAARRRTDEPAAIPRRVQRRRHSRHGHVGTAVRRTARPARRVHRHTHSRTGVAALLSLWRQHDRRSSSAR